MNKQINKFKIGDVLKIKSNVVTPEKVHVGDRVGRVINVHDEGEVIEFEWDSKTLKNISDSELKNIYIKDEIVPFYMFVPVNELEPAEARDTIEELETVQDIIEKKVLKLSKEKEDKNYFRFYTEKWIRRFNHSSFFKNLTYFQQENLEFIVDTFSELMFEYHEQLPKEWDVEALIDVCVNLVPQKIASDDETFKNYGTVLLAFFKFIEDKNYFNTKELQKSIKSIDKDIYTNSKLSENWDDAKSFTMFAMEKGYDFDNQKQMEKAMEEFNNNLNAC